MKQYLQLLDELLQDGVTNDNRTGIKTKMLNGKMLKFNLADGFPVITTRKIPFRIAFEETMMFLRGETNTKTLEEKGINIWRDNTSRTFLDKQGLSHLEEGDMGKGYSHQWRNFGGLKGYERKTGVDQIDKLLKNMKTQPQSRRHIITAWNPGDLDEAALPPCHVMFFYTIMPDNTLNSSFVMRSSDVYHGLPFNIMSYAFLQTVFAKYLGLKPGELTYFGWDVHIYEHQIPVIKQQLKREPFELPELVIYKELKSFDDILSLEFTDVELVGYEYHAPLEKVRMAV